MFSKLIVTVTLLVFIISLKGLCAQESMMGYWSVCNNSQFCLTTPSADHGIIDQQIPNPITVNIQGFFVFYDNESAERSTLAEFFFDSNFGKSHRLTETSTNVVLISRFGAMDYREPSLSTAFQVDLFGGSINRHYESIGDLSGNDCENIYITIRSFVISGSERWQLFGRNGTSVCIQVEDTFSFVPGIVKDISTLGFDMEWSNMCGIMRGCSKPPNEVIKIPNYEKTGVLRRQIRM